MTTTLTHCTRPQPGSQPDSQLGQTNTDPSVSMADAPTALALSDGSGATPTMPDSTGQARQYHACLVMHDGHRFCALTDEGTIWVVTAAGCLLQPAVGDMVLVSVAGASGYILNVLERGRPDQAAVLSVQGALKVKAGAIEIATSQSLTLNAGPSLNTIAARSETHVGYSTRRIAGHEEITAASFRQSVTHDWSVQAGTAALVGKNRTVIDGDSVQIG